MTGLLNTLSSRIIAAAFCALLVALVTGASAQPAAGTGKAYVLTVDDAIGPATRDYIVRGIEQAEDEDAGLVVLRLNTPGGLDASMRDIIRKFLASEVPVVTWVAPAGSRAASAGTYMLYASHVAAMAPATNLGAATPVQIGGGGGGGGEQEGEQSAPLERLRDALEDESGEGEGQSEQEDASAESGSADEPAAPEQPDERQEPPETPSGDASSRKVINDAVAYIKGLAERHGRNAEWAERAVREAVSLGATEALEQNVIDVVAESLPALLEAIDGREVRMDDGMQTLATADLETIEIEPDWRTELLSIITNPTLAYILLMVGIYGLILEGYNPGALVPGVIGGICLLLALYAFQILPVNYAGLALMALGLALIAVELFVPSFGILGVGGVVAVTFGSVILFDSGVPGLEMNTGLIAGMGFGSALIFGAIIWLAARSIRKPRLGGEEAMVGQQAEAISDFSDGHGRVHLNGEDWRARAEQPIARGDRVRVTGMKDEGFVLDVEPVKTGSSPD
ncbi:MAG: nodulation protein NfeD [Wenzhouxiangellaceae bacterium]|nr:nodulation protein NfeD [Wenzhouxiangellaceae bacterium]